MLRIGWQGPSLEAGHHLTLPAPGREGAWDGRLEPPLGTSPSSAAKDQGALGKSFELLKPLYSSAVK